MTARCKVCGHPERASIDAAIVAGEPQRSIAVRYGLSKGSVARHTQHSASVGPVRREASEARERTILERVRAIAKNAQESFEASLRIAREVDPDTGRPADLPTMSAADALREMGRMLELEAKITGALAPKKVLHTIRDMTAAEQLAEIRTLEREIAEERARLEAEAGRTIQ